MPEIQNMQDYSFKFSDVVGDYLSKDTVDIKDRLDRQPKEVREFVVGLVNLLNSINGADYISAKGFDGLKTTIQAMLNDLNSRKLDQTGDFKGTLNGMPIVAADPGLSSTVSYHTTQLKDIVRNIKTYGAIGDGSNSSNSLLSAIADLPNGGTVLIPNGAYALNVSTTCNNIKIINYGKIIPVSGKTDYVLELNGNNNSLENFVCEGSSYVHYMIKINGNHNTVKNSKLYFLAKSTATQTIYSDALIYVNGVDNIISSNEFYNGAIGIQVGNKRNSILSNDIHDNITGIHMMPSSRDCEIAFNQIRDNNVNSYQGADGILAQRNVSRIKIHNNTISGSGEHGIYFQGDNSAITDNIVISNLGCGIKLASYLDQLYWHTDETPNASYIGHNNIIKGNICKNNNGGTDAGIYLQSPLSNIQVEGNKSDNNTYGIRTVFINATDVLKDISVINNDCFNNTTADISIVGREGIIVKANRLNYLSFSGASTSDLMVKPIIEGNIVYKNFSVNRMSKGLFQSNQISLDIGNALAITTCDSLRFIGNLIETYSDIDLTYVSNFDRNNVTFLAQAKFMGNTSASSFCDNYINASLNIGLSAYVFAPTTMSSPMKLHDNTVITGGNARTLIIVGNGHSIKNNVFPTVDTANSYTIQLKGNNCIVMGNTAGSVTYSLVRLDTGVRGHMIVNNLLNIDNGSGLTNNLIANNSSNIPA